MPAALPLIASVAAATAFEGVVIFGLSAAVSSSIISGAVGLATSLVVGALTPKPKAPDLSAALAEAGAGRTQQVRQPVSPHQVIAGRVKASGIIVFIHTMNDDEGRANGYLYLVHAVAGHEVRAISNISFSDELVSARIAVDGTFAALVRTTTHLGAADQLADADMVSEIGDPEWGDDHRLRGRAYIATRLKWEPTAFGSGVPNIAAIIDGVEDAYDPRTGATGWTNNAALFVARWFTAPWGMALDWAELSESSVIAAANVCDERVRVAAGSATMTALESGGSPTGAFSLSSGARALDVGDGVRVTSTGTLPAGLDADTTYYLIPVEGAIRLAATAADAIGGGAIAISSVGTGTQTLIYWDEARYKINGSFTLDAAKGSVLEQLLSAMAGVAVYIGGKWFIHAGSPATPAIELDENDLRGDLTWVPKRSMRDRFNGVRAVIVNPSANWQPVDLPPLQSADYLAEDAGEELYEDLRFPFTTSPQTGQRLQKIALERNRRQGTLTFPAKLTGLRLQVWDGVYVSIARYGWVRKQFRVIGWALAEDGGVDLTLQEDDSAVYEWTASEERDSAVQQGVVLPDPNTIAAPASIVVDTPTIPIYSRLNATVGAVKSIWFDGYDVEFRPRSFITWSSTGRIDTELVSIVTSEAVDIQARAVTRSGSPSAFTQSLAPAKPTDLEVVDTTITWVNGTGVAEVQVFSGTTSLDAATLYDTVPATPASFDVAADAFYWLRSVSADGNVSNMTASVTVGTPGGVGNGDGGDGSDGGSGGDGGDGGGDE